MMSPHFVKLFFLLLLIGLIGGRSSRAQAPSEDCAKQSPLFQEVLKRQESYVPENGKKRTLTVDKKIKLRFVIFEKEQPGKPQQNFRPENLSDLKLMVQWLNDMMKTLAIPQNPAREICGDCYILDERLQVELVEVQFIQDSLAVSEAKETEGVMNIFFFVNDHKTSSDPKYLGVHYGGGWSYTGGGFRGPHMPPTFQIYLFNTYLASIEYPEKINPESDYYKMLWNETLRLLHELHHSLGLGHLQENRPGNYGFDLGGCSGTDFLIDAFPDGCPVPYDEKKTNNIMNTGYWSNTLTPLQIGRVHRTAFLGQMGKYMYPVLPLHRYPWVVDSNQTFDFTIRMFQNIHIKKGKILRVKCLLEMPPGGKIVIEKGGRLIVDGGSITAYDDKSTWEGVFKKGTRRSKENQVYLLNGGQMRNIQNRD